MLRIDPKIVEHRISLLPHSKPFKQKLRRMQDEWSLKIKEEIEKKLLLIEPILYGGLTVMTGTLFLILYYPIQLAIQQLPF